jgi:hypothetical protein
MINSKKYYWLIKNILTNQFSVKVQKKLSRATRDIPLAGTSSTAGQRGWAKYRDS